MIRVMACAPKDGAPGNLAANTRAILERISEAREMGAGLLVLPELCLTSSGLGDLFSHQSVRLACEEAMRTIEKACRGLDCVIGLPAWDTQGVYSALALIRDGQAVALAIKNSLTRQQRRFLQGDCPKEIAWGGRLLPCAAHLSLPLPGKRGNLFICFESDWEKQRAAAGGAALIALPALKPALAGCLANTPDWLAGEAAPGQTLIYANAGGNESTTDLVYAGEAAIAQQGGPLAFAPAFLGGAAIADVEIGKAPGKRIRPALADERDKEYPFAPAEGPRRAAWCREALEICARGLAVRMKRIHAETVTLGLSGGLDSAMALAISLRALDILGLGREGVLAWSLPGLGSSARTRRNALRLMKAFGLAEREIDLKDSIHQHFRDIGQDPGQHDTAYENAQARERTQVLMDLANRHGGLMVGTGDLSELALGYTTFGGDHLSMYGVNAGLYKSAIRLILGQVIRDSESPLLIETLRDILDTPVSAELLPGGGEIAQKTEEILGPYALNDFFLHSFLRGGTPEGILQGVSSAFQGRFHEDEILRRMEAFFTRFFNSQFKRNCLPDGPMALGVSLSPREGFTLASDVSAAVFMDSIQQLKGNMAR